MMKTREISRDDNLGDLENSREILKTGGPNRTKN